MEVPDNGRPDNGGSTVITNSLKFDKKLVPVYNKVFRSHTILYIVFVQRKAHTLQ